MNITIPGPLAAHEPFLRDFFEAMIFKLLVNAHKDMTVAKDVPLLIDRAMGELSEFKDELVGEDIDHLDFSAIGPNSLIELADMGNYVYLLFWFLRKQGVPDARDLFIQTFFIVDAEKGQIFAKASRSGSKYKAGDEIEGTYRAGRVHIRMQHAVSGASISVPRSHVIWRVQHGQWPVGEVKHRDGDTNNDRADNLFVDETRSTKEYPFVTRWAPKGREGTENWGKFQYQRRHNCVLVKSGYYDTEEEAAVKGLAEWKEKTRGSQD